jgi:hypothetical protein
LDFAVDDTNLGGRHFSKETSQSSGSLKLCRANVEMGGLPSGETKKPMRGDSMEAWDRGQRGEYLGEGHGLERIGRHSSGNTVFVVTDSAFVQSLEAAVWRSDVAGLPVRLRAAKNGMKGRRVVRRSSLSLRENL